MPKAFAGLLVAALGLAGSVQTAGAADAPLTLEGKISLGSVAGRIDHIAVDLKRRRAFVAELGNNTVNVVDLAGQRVLKRLAGFEEPQGVAWVAASDRLFVANAGDGAVHIYAGDNLDPAGLVPLGDDADNMRVDAANRVFVGFGNGGLALLDGATGHRLASLPLPAHPEAFEIAADGKRAFVNTPGAGQITVVDTQTGAETAKWSAGRLRDNFPMAQDAAGNRLFVVWRNQPTVTILDMATGKLLQELPTCGDPDDIFYDAKRQRAYVSCGAGFLAVFDAAPGTLREIARLPTRSGARTSLFEPTLDRLFLAVRSQQGAPAELWIYRP